MFLLLAPPARGFHAVAYDAGRGVTVLFGGQNSSWALVGDTWEWDGVAWTHRTTATAPSPRAVHAMAYDMARGRVVLFGGAAGTGSGTDNDETWEWNGVTWTQMQPTVRPSARRGASMAYVPTRGVCVLFGGGITGSGTPVLNDTWEWNGSTWTQYMPAVRPPARWSSYLAAVGTGRVLLSGGGAGFVELYDTWTWDGVAWQQVFPAVQPIARRLGGAAFDSQRNLLVAWGGAVTFFDPWGPYLNPDGSTWVWDGSNWRLDSRPFAPVGRYATAAAYDVSRGRVVAFGGFNPLPLQDTWEYEAGPLAACASSGPGCPGPLGVPVLAPSAGPLPLLGTNWFLRLTYGSGIPGIRVGSIAIGWSDQMWSGGTLPFDLTALGMTGCTLRVSTEFVQGMYLQSGHAYFAWPLPATPSLAGIQFFAQGLVLETAANPLGAVMSNALAASTGPY